MEGLEFPLYGMRTYDSIEEVGNYKVITTPKSKYVLDYVTSDASTYVNRRIRLLGDKNKPFKIYPLSTRITDIAGMFHSKTKHFIDAKGKLYTWVPKKFYPIISYKILHKYITKAGTMLIKTKASTALLHCARNDAAYVRLINLNGMYIVYDFCDVELPKTRKKL